MLAPNTTRFKKMEMLMDLGYYSLFKAIDVHQQSTHLLKEFSLKKNSHSQIISFFRECELLKVVSHPFILKLQECYKVKSNKLVMVFEYPDKGLLQSYLKTRGDTYISENRVERWIMQLVLALACLHENDIVHRNLSTVSLYLNENKDIKLGDFSYLINKKAKGHCPIEKSISIYSAPEIVTKREYGFKSDIWALGVLLFEITTKRSPFESDSINDLSTSILNDQPSNINSKYSNSLQSFIFSLLNKNPEQRPGIKQILSGQYIKSILEKYPSYLRIKKKNYKFDTICFDNIQQCFNSLKIYRFSQFKSDDLLTFSQSIVKQISNLSQMYNESDSLNRFESGNLNTVLKNLKSLDIYNKEGEVVKKSICDLSSSSEDLEESVVISKKVKLKPRVKKVATAKNILMIKRHKDKAHYAGVKARPKHSRTVEFTKENVFQGSLKISGLKKIKNKQKAKEPKNKLIHQMINKLCSSKDVKFMCKKDNAIGNSKIVRKIKHQLNQRKVIRNEDNLYSDRIIDSRKLNNNKKSHNGYQTERSYSRTFTNPMNTFLKSQNLVNMKKRFKIGIDIKNYLSKHGIANKKKTKHPSWLVERKERPKYKYLDYMQETADNRLCHLKKLAIGKVLTKFS